VATLSLKKKYYTMLIF